MQIRTVLGAAALAMSLGTAHPAWSQANAAASQEELLFWDTIKNSGNPADFQEYLKQYPNGRFAGLARIRVRNASPAAASTLPQSAAGKAIAPTESRTASFPSPQKGDAWTYRYLDRKYGRKQEQFSVRVDGVAENAVTEVVAVEGAPGDSRRIDLKKLGFSSRALLAGHTLIEFAPYLASMETPPQLPYRMRAGSGYPIGNASAGDWQVVLATLPNAVVTVPAGKFEVKCFDLKGSRRAQFGLERFQLTAWYAPEAKRYVRLEHRRWNAGAALIEDDLVELAEFAR